MLLCSEREVSRVEVLVWAEEGLPSAGRVDSREAVEACRRPISILGNSEHETEAISADR